MKKILYLYFILSLQFVGFAFSSCSKGVKTDPEKQPGSSTTDNSGGYLFAHMTHAAYGKLFYSVSRDGLKWETLNNSKIILPDYIGHPDICKGKDDKYYMVGVDNLTQQNPILWMSDDLIVWRREDLPSSIFTTQMPNNPTDAYLGAPKLFYDEDSEQYIMTWHAYFAGLTGDALWEGMRTFYVLTSDFKTFTEPKRLFDFTGTDADLASIDVIIRKVDDTYYAIIKDERWPEKSATGKTNRIATSTSLTGPYSNPGPPITPAWHEAPTIVKSMDDKNWFLYVEDYRAHQYKLFKANSLTGSMWSQVEFTPPVARHGCVIKVDEKVYEGIVKAYTVK